MGWEGTSAVLRTLSDVTKRVIAHLDCDAFFASVELLRRPELRGLPVIVAGSGPRAVVTTASYEARRFGIGSAMSAAEARRRCPQAVTIPPDHSAYSETSQQVWGLVRERLQVVQQAGIDEAYADLTGIEKPLRVLRELIAHVKEQTGIQISAGIAPNRLVAKIASDLGKPAGFVAIGREQCAAHIADRSPRIVPGIGPKTAARLAEMGYPTLGALQIAPLAELQERFGERSGEDLHRRAHLHDESPVETTRVVKSRSVETTFDIDVADHAQLEDVLRQQSKRLAEGMQRKEIRGRTIGIKVRLDDWTTVTRARSLPTYVNDEATIAKVAVGLFREYAPQRPVRLLGVRMAAFEHVEKAEDPDEPRASPSGQLALAMRPGAVPPRSYLRVGGRQLFHQRRGSGEPLLLIQGMSGTHLAWGEPFLSELERDFDVVAYDHRGIGHSERVDSPFSIAELASDAAGLLDVLGWDSAHVLGVSVGGIVAQELALHRAERIRTLTLGCTSCGGPGSALTPPATIERLAADMVSGNSELAIRAGYAVGVSHAFAADPNNYALYRSMAVTLPVPLPLIMVQMQAIAGHDSAARLPSLALPTLVLHGDQDELLPVQNGRLIASLMPDARLEILEGVGHLFWWEQPQRSAELLRAHALAASVG
jgi:DNA polymerase-4